MDSNFLSLDRPLALWYPSNKEAEMPPAHPAFASASGNPLPSPAPEQLHTNELTQYCPMSQTIQQTRMSTPRPLQEALIITLDKLEQRFYTLIGTSHNTSNNILDRDKHKKEEVPCQTTPLFTSKSQPVTRQQQASSTQTFSTGRFKSTPVSTTTCSRPTLARAGAS